MEPKTYYTHFEIPSCSHTGCVNYMHEGCWLHGLTFAQYSDQVEGLHNAKICLARRQADLYRTERMLHD